MENLLALCSFRIWGVPGKSSRRMRKAAGLCPIYAGLRKNRVLYDEMRSAILNQIFFIWPCIFRIHLICVSSPFSLKLARMGLRPVAPPPFSKRRAKNFGFDSLRPAEKLCSFPAGLRVRTAERHDSDSMLSGRTVAINAAINPPGRVTQPKYLRQPLLRGGNAARIAAMKHSGQLTGKR